MITTQRLADWLNDTLPPGVLFVVGPEMPDKPDRCAAITRGPGRVEHEGALDRGTFSIRLRGPMHDRDQAETDIENLRKVIELIPAPEGMSSCWNTGPSIPVPGTPDSGRRYEYVATFVALTE